QVRRALEETADDLGAPGFDRSTGHGLARVDRAIAAELPPDDIPAAAFDLRATGLAVEARASLAESPPVSNVLWEWGDGETSTEPNATHAYRAGGVYPVTLTVVAASGARGVATRAIEVADDD